MRIEVYYNGIKDANNAVDEFRNNGFINSAVDLNDKYIDFENYNYNFSDAIMNSGIFSNDQYKSSEIGSGMGNLNDVLNSKYKVIINTDTNSEDTVNNLKILIYKTGGTIIN